MAVSCREGQPIFSHYEHVCAQRPVSTVLRRLGKRAVVGNRLFAGVFRGFPLRVSLPGQGSHVAGLVTRNARSKLQTPIQGSLFVSSTDQERNSVVKFAASQHEYCLISAR